MHATRLSHARLKPWSEHTANFGWTSSILKKSLRGYSTFTKGMVAYKQEKLQAEQPQELACAICIFGILDESRFVESPNLYKIHLGSQVGASLQVLPFGLPRLGWRKGHWERWRVLLESAALLRKLYVCDCVMCRSDVRVCVVNSSLAIIAMFPYPIWKALKKQDLQAKKDSLFPFLRLRMWPKQVGEIYAVSTTRDQHLNLMLLSHKGRNRMSKPKNLQCNPIVLLFLTRVP